jgi:hypothetical protein
MYIFTGFGNVVELRINTKGVGGKLPNFGFVVFDDSEPVQRILIAKVSDVKGIIQDLTISVVYNINLVHFKTIENLFLMVKLKIIHVKWYLCKE